MSKPKLPPVTATRQFDGFVIADVSADQVEGLKTLLGEISRQTVALMRGEPTESPIIAFEDLRTVHYARFVLLEPSGGNGHMLVLSTNYDGPEGESSCPPIRALENHINDLVQSVGDGLEQVFEHCDGFTKGGLRSFIAEGQRKASTFYVGTSGRSRDQARWEEQLRRDVDAVLDDNAVTWKGWSPDKVRTAVRAKLDGKYPTIPKFDAQPDLTARVKRLQKVIAGFALSTIVGGFYFAWSWVQLPNALHVEGALWDDAIRIAVVLGLDLVLLAIPVAILLGYFRRLEKTDPQFQPVFDAATHQHLSEVSVGENEFLQNQLTHLAYIKPGTLRWLLIRGVFFALQILATSKYNKGKLGGIPSIHFARWVLLPNRAVLFLSNFDSSWQSYLGDFIDQASTGLTAVWSNTIGYPRATWLVKAGSRDASRFLGWTREHQQPTQVWYSAYPGLSVVNINTNTEIRRGLADPDAMDAATWLFHLRGVDRFAVDEQYGAMQARAAPLRLKDVQGMILKGLGFRPDARYLMLRVNEAASSQSVRRFLSGLALTSAQEASREVRPPDPLVNVAMTYQGMKAMGLDDQLCDAFSSPFVQGSHDPSRLLVNGDVGDNGPEHWRWGGSADTMPHVMLAVFGHNDGDSPHGAAIQHHVDALVAEAAAAGLDLLVTLEGQTNPDRKEHFGFRDGIGQPTVRGSGRIEANNNTIAPGEILLGHPDGYGNITHSPVSPSGFAFGFNGSYMVFRQLKQEVEAFWAYCDSDKDAGNAITAASKMIGRWPSGASLVRHPDGDPNDARFIDENNFSYLANDAHNDRYGARCPFGAHIRRSNPRDWELGGTVEESLELSNLHRIIRRGRPYGPALVASMDATEIVKEATGSTAEQRAAAPERGLQFLCFNANIERQFEFVQQQWCNNPKFAGLVGDADPLLGPGRPPQELGLETQSFTTQTDVRKQILPRHTNMQRFVTVVGSAYFFMPSIRAMRLLKDDALTPAGKAKALEQAPPDEQLYITDLIDTLRQKMMTDYAGRQTLRGAHPKMHGCVEATFNIEPKLDPRLRAGIFAEGMPSSHQALVRFSNASETAQDDAKADIRGVAIKLLGVEGDKLIDGEEHSKNHDFLLISHNRFMSPDVQEFSALTAALTSGKLARYLLTHPATAVRVIRAMGKHPSPLTIPYWSVVPYLLGCSAVKYKLSLSKPEAAEIPANPTANYLSDALWKRLGEGDVSFDFMVQLQTDPDSMPVEDATVGWSERTSPFIKVATLVIGSQTLQDPGLPQLQRRAEDMTFNPWRCLPDHRPLGGLNRARRQIYRALSSFRHGRNAVDDQSDPPEPDAMSDSLARDDRESP